MLLVALQALTQILISYQWKRLAQIMDPQVSLMQMLRMNMVGSFVESITPSVKFGGEAVKIWWLKTSYNWSGIKAASLLMLQKSISGAMFILVTLLFTVFFMSSQWSLFSAQWSSDFSLPSGMGGWLLFFFSAIVVFMLLLQFKNPRGFIEKAIDRLSEMIESIKSHWNALNQRKREKKVQFMLSGFIWLLYPIKMIILSRSIGIEISFIAAGAVVFMAYMAAMIPISPGGIGTFEGTMVVLLAYAEIGPSQALALAIVFRTITFWLVCLISGAFTSYLQLKRVFRPVTEGL